MKRLAVLISMMTILLTSLQAQIGSFNKVYSDSVFSRDYRFRSLPNYSIYNALNNITSGDQNLATPPGTTTQRPTVPSGKIILRFNTDSNALEYGNSSQVWKTLSTGSIQIFDTSSIPNFYLKVRSLFSTTSPIQYNAVTGNILLPPATSTQSGYLSSSDWVVFNSRLPDPGSNGLVARTASGITAARQLIAASSNISIVNPTGVSGNPSIDVNDTLLLRQLQLPYIPASLSAADSALFLNRSTGFLEVRALNGGGINNINIGSGYRLLNSFTQTLRTLYPGFGLNIDSTVNSNGLTLIADTSATGLPSKHYIDSSVISITGNNGVTRTGSTIQLGQTIGASGDPAALSSSREIPLNSLNLVITGTGSVGIGTNTPSAFAKEDVLATGIIVGVKSTAASGAAFNGTSNLTAIIGQSLGANIGVNGLSNGGYGVVGSGGIGGIGGRFYTVAQGNTPDLVSLELERLPTGTGVTDGVGQTIMFRLPYNNGSTGNESGRIKNYFSSASPVTPSSNFSFHLINAGVSARKALLAYNGQWTWDGYTAGNFQTIDTSFNSLVVDNATGIIYKRAGAGGSGGGESPLTFNSPLSRSVNTISLPAATTTTNGYMSAVLVQKYDTAVRGRVYTASQFGVPNDADLSMGSSTFGTNGRTTAQALLDKGQAGPMIILWDTKTSIDSTLTIYPGTKIVAAVGCGLIARNSMNCNMLMNAHPSTGARNDSNIVIEGMILNGNGANQIHHSKISGWVVLAKFVGVKHLVLRNMQLLVSRTFHTWVMNSEDITFDNIYINYGPGVNAVTYGNFDGLHFNGPCRNISLNSINGLTFDDIIAFNADDVWQNSDTAAICIPGGNINTYDPYATYGNITDFHVSNVKFLPGTKFGIRLLANASSIKNGTFDGVEGTTELQTLIADGWQDGCPAHTGSGVIDNITCINWKAQIQSSSSSYKDTYFSFGANIKNFTISNAIRSDFTAIGNPYIKCDASANISLLKIDGLHYEGATSNTVPVIQLASGATIDNLVFNNYTATTVPTYTDNALVNINAGATVNNLQISVCNTDSINYGVIDNGTLNNISVCNVLCSHEAVGTGFLYVGVGKTVQNYFLSNFNGGGPYVLASGATITNTGGDAFTSNPNLQAVTTAGATTTNDISTSASLTFTHSGSNRNFKLYNSASSDNFAAGTFYPSAGTNVGQALSIFPKGTGLSSSIRAQLDIGNTDIIADGTNFEDLLFRAAGTEMDIWSLSNGTGTPRPIKIFTGSASSPNTNQLVIKTDGSIQFGLYTTGGDNELIYGNSTGVLNHYSGGSNGQVLTKSTGGFSWQTVSHGDLQIINDANYTVLSTDGAIRYQAILTADRTVTLPSAASFPQREIWIKWNQLGGHSIFVASSSSIYFDGTANFTSYASNVDFYTVCLKSDGTSWYRIN